MRLMKRLAAPRNIVLAALLLVGAGAISFAAVSAGSSGSRTPASTDGSFLAVAPTATPLPPPPPQGLSEPESPPQEPPPTPTQAPPPTPGADVPRPDCVLTVIDAGTAIHEHDQSGRAIVVHELETVRNECTGEILTRDKATGKLAACTTLVTIPAQPAARITESGEEEIVGLIEVIHDFCTGQSFTRDPETGNIWPLMPAPHQDVGALLDQ